MAKAKRSTKKSKKKPVKNISIKRNSKTKKTKRNYKRKVKVPVNKHHHPLLIFFVVVLLLFTISFQYGKIQKNLNYKQVAAEMIESNNTDLALNYCRNMNYRNYECFDMYIEAKELLNEKFDKSICMDINVGNLPWWTTQEQERQYFLKFREVKNECLNY